MRKMGIWREYLTEKLADPESAIAYLQAILEDYQNYSNNKVVLRGLHTVVNAQGGILEFAKKADMDPQLLSKIISHEDTPLIDALGIVLKVLGCQLSIAPIESKTYSGEIEGQNTSTQVAENQTE